jgi:hypothetical protein
LLRARIGGELGCDFIDALLMEQQNSSYRSAGPAIALTQSFVAGLSYPWTFDMLSFAR